jgi:DNA-directed RNA polymerase specialized sigma24 family protein
MFTPPHTFIRGCAQCKENRTIDFQPDGRGWYIGDPEMESNLRKKDWILTAEALELLLSRLDSDREQAAHKYEQMRRALLIYFEQHGSLSPAEHADETLDRVARSLTEGKVIYIENPAGYFYGVARNVLRQYRKTSADKFFPVDDLPPGNLKDGGPLELYERDQERFGHERMLDCLEGCLNLLPEQNREIMLQYYDGETRVKIDKRKQLAERLNISVKLLRVRAMRIRERLEGCVQQCLINIGTLL